MQCGVPYSSSSSSSSIAAILPSLPPPPPPPGGGTAAGFLWWPIVVSVGGAALLACVACFAFAGYRRRKKKEEEEGSIAPPAAETALDGNEDATAALQPEDHQAMSSFPPLEPSASPREGAAKARPPQSPRNTPSPRSSWMDATGVQLQEVSGTRGSMQATEHGSGAVNHDVLGLDYGFGASVTHLPMPPQPGGAAVVSAAAATMAVASTAPRTKWKGLGGGNDAGSDDAEEIGKEPKGASGGDTVNPSRRPKWASLTAANSVEELRAGGPSTSGVTAPSVAIASGRSNIVGMKCKSVDVHAFR